MSVSTRVPSTELSLQHALPQILEHAYSECGRLVHNVGVAAALDRLVGVLQNARAAAPYDFWKHSVRAARVHGLHEILLADPYIRDAVQKPRGYAGDAHTLDFVYRRRPLESGVSSLGLEIHAVSTGVGIAQAVRERCAHMAAHVSACLAARVKPVVASIACGHMRELHHVREEDTVGATFIGLDQDPLSTDALATLHPGFTIVPLTSSIKDLIVGSATIPRADLVYAAGLYDYLEDRYAVPLTRSLLARLVPGGKLVIANLTPMNPEIALMEAVMDWWMEYRDEAALNDVAVSACATNAGFSTEVRSLHHNRVAELTIIAPD